MTAGPEAVAVPSARKLALTTAAAAGVALLLLVTVVLPAEYGLDPLHTGALLGLNAMASQPVQPIPPPPGSSLYKPVQEGPNASYAAAYSTDRAQFTLGPYEYVEYKYHLEKDAGMLFSWTATEAVGHDFHGEADAGPAGQAVSYDKKSRREGHGNFTAPFTGIHGWYWENKGGKTVTVSISSAGFYSSAIEFQMNRTKRIHQLTSFPNAAPAGPK